MGRVLQSNVLLKSAPITSWKLTLLQMLPAVVGSCMSLASNLNFRFTQESPNENPLAKVK